MGIVRKDVTTDMHFKKFAQNQHLYMKEKEKILARTELSTEEEDTKQNLGRDGETRISDICILHHSSVTKHVSFLHTKLYNATC